MVVATVKELCKVVGVRRVSGKVKTIVSAV